ncbi:hypothetical protein ACJZ2D_004418 [Fusarium nematophilum]
MKYEINPPKPHLDIPQAKVFRDTPVGQGKIGAEHVDPVNDGAAEEVEPVQNDSIFRDSEYEEDCLDSGLCSSPNSGFCASSTLSIGQTFRKFILGIVEVPLFLGAVFLMFCWYTRRELALQAAILYSSLVLAQVEPGLIAAGVIPVLRGAKGLAGWRTITLHHRGRCWSSAAMWGMTEQLRHLASVRIQAGRVSVAIEKQSVWTGLRLALRDCRTWISAVTNICMISSYGFNNFSPPLV